MQAFDKLIEIEEVITKQKSLLIEARNNLTPKR